MENTQKFYFQAVDNESRRVSGSIFAENEEVARNKLKKQGLALFAIEEFDESKDTTKKGLTKFEFEGVNSEKKVVHGKIEAVSDYEAYKKLRKEYSFEVNYIVDTNLPPEARNKAISQGIPEEFLALYKTDSFAFKKIEKKRKKETELVEMSEKDKKELAFYSHEIGIMSQEIRELLEKSGDYLKREEKRNILARLGLIERLRQSNAVDHLKTLTKKLVDQMADDKIFMEDAINSEASPEILSARRKFKNYSAEKQKSIAAKALEINIAFNIDPRKIAVEIYKVKPLTQIGFVLYWAIVSIFCLMAILWIKNGIELLYLKNNIKESLFIFRSLLLWLITCISFINMMVFSPMVFVDKKFSTRAKIISFVIAIILNISVIIALPLIL